MNARMAMVDYFSDHIEELLDLINLDAVTDCAVWEGAFDEQQRPCYYIDKTMFDARAIFFALRTKSFVTSMRFTTSCGNAKCVNPLHFLNKNGKQAIVIRPPTPTVQAITQTVLPAVTSTTNPLRLTDRVRGTSGTERIKVYAQ